MPNIITFPSAAERSLVRAEAAYNRAVVLAEYDRRAAISAMIEQALDTREPDGQAAAALWLHGHTSIRAIIEDGQIVGLAY